MYLSLSGLCTYTISRDATCAWYLAEDFAEVRAMMEDGHAMHRTHAEWLLAAEQVEQRRRASGVFVYRATLQPLRFRAWCQLRGRKMDAQARNEFASELAHEFALDARQAERSHWTARAADRVQSSVRLANLDNT